MRHWLSVAPVLALLVGCGGGADPEQPLPRDHPASPEASEDAHVPPDNPFAEDLPHARERELAAVYTCPMHPDITSPTPGECPTCGMRLDAVKVKESGDAVYTCPMHPDISSPTGGDCAKCGMKLEPRKDKE